MFRTRACGGNLSQDIVSSLADVLSILFIFKNTNSSHLCMVACFCNLSSWEAEVGGSGVQIQPSLHTSSPPDWASWAINLIKPTTALFTDTFFFLFQCLSLLCSAVVSPTFLPPVISFSSLNCTVTSLEVFF